MCSYHARLSSLMGRSRPHNITLLPSIYCKKIFFALLMDIHRVEGCGLTANVKSCFLFSIRLNHSFDDMETHI